MEGLQKSYLLKKKLPQIVKKKPCSFYQLAGYIMFSSLLTALVPVYSSERQPISEASTTTQDLKQQLLDQMQDYRNREATKAIELRRAKEAAAKRAADTREWQRERELKMWPQYGSFRVYWPGWSYDKRTRSWLTFTRIVEKSEIPGSISVNFQPVGQQPDKPTGSLIKPLRPNFGQLGDEPPVRFDASLEALVREGVITQAEFARTRGTKYSPGPPGVAVDCSSLMLNIKPRDSAYLGWIRPSSGSEHERLIIDFCATKASTLDTPAGRPHPDSTTSPKDTSDKN